MNKTNFAVGILFICFSLVYFFYFIPTQIISSVDVNEFAGAIFSPDTFPMISITLFALLSVMLSVSALRNKENPEILPRTSMRSFFQVLVVAVVGYGYVLLLEPIGFLVATPFFLAVLVIFFGTRDWRYVISVVLIAPPAVNYFFWFSFKVILPEGEIFTGY